MWRAMKNASNARTTSEPMIIPRRPPRARSIAGPSSGVTMANGAIVSTRYNATRQRASEGSMEKKIEPASATAIQPSPITDRA